MKTKVYSIEEFEKELDDIHSDTKDAFLYEGQLVPIRLNYKTSPASWIADKDIRLGKRFNVKKGDRLFLSCASKANGSADSANSYTLTNIDSKKYSPLLNLIPYSGVAGSIDDYPDHYDAIIQLKNLDAILRGELETEVENSESCVKATGELIPEGDFYVSFPRNSDTGFNGANKVIQKNGEYLKLRKDHWVSTKEAMTHGYDGKFNEDFYNIWDRFDDKNKLAWYIEANAGVILKESDLNKDNAYNELWNVQYEHIKKRSIEMFNSK